MRMQIATVLLLVTLAPVVGCKSIAKALVRKAEEQAAAEASAAIKAAGTRGTRADATEDDVLGEKLSAYIDCTNNTRRVNDSFRNYLRWVGGKDGRTFPAKPNSSPNLFEINEQHQGMCGKKLQAAHDLVPAIAALDVPALAYSAAVAKLAPLLARADKYYGKMSDYKDDNYAKGRAMHAELLAAFDEFDKAGDTFGEEITKANTVHLRKVMDEVERTEGRKLHWQKMQFDVKAKIFVNLLDEEDTTPEALKAAVVDMSAGLTALSDYAKANATETSKVTMWSMYESAAESYVSSAKDVARDFTGKTPITKRKRGAGRDIVDYYNELINRGNGLQF
jgi:Protein of unknown function (DUF3829)